MTRAGDTHVLRSLRRALVPTLALPLVVAAGARCGSSSNGSSPDAGDNGSGDDAAGSSGGSGGGTGGSSSGGGAGGSSTGAVGSGDSGSAGSTDGGVDASKGGTDGGKSDAGTTAYDVSVYQHHKNGMRDGVYIDAVLTSGMTGAASTIHTATSFGGAITGSYGGMSSSNIYAQPLYVTSGPNGHAAFVVATELNHVTTFDSSTGSILWDNGPTSTITYGSPVTGGLPCGTILPLGITGTPFIDYSSGSGVIYFDAMTNAGGTAKHMVWAIKVQDGSPLPNWPVDVSAKVANFNSPYQNQRGALQLVNGVLYVPYGGLNGDCSDGAEPYYGWVVGFPLNNPQSPTGWHTSAPKGGIWGPGALPTDGTSIFPVTGNTTASGTTWGGGEAVIRLGAGPTFVSTDTKNYYAPYNWKTLDNNDTDLGGASEVLFDMPGTSTPHLVGVGGKDGNFYILDRDNLGGIGTSQATSKELFLGMSFANSQFKGAPAAYTTAKGTYVVFHVEGGSGNGCPTGENGNLVAIRVTAGATKPTAAVAWCSIESGLGSPMVTTTDGTSDAIVWDATDKLVGYDGDDGTRIVNGSNTTMTTAMQGWNTPIDVGGGRIAVLVNGQLYVFTAP